MRRTIYDQQRGPAQRTGPERLVLTRRQMLSGLAAGVTLAGCSNSSDSSVDAPSESSTTSGAPGRAATDQVRLGSTDIQISRLAMGSGTRGVNGASDQTRSGTFTQVLVDSFDQGITFWETADQYGAHPHLREALRTVGRNNVVVLTKTHAETRQEMEADLVRFREELGVDHIDILLLHNKTSATWTTDCAGAMEVLSEAKARGEIRAHGVSCHSLPALELAAASDWVDVDLARINPFGLHMDADPATVISVLDRMKAAGKGVLGMKILAQGDGVDQLDRALGHAVGLDCLDGFTIGFTSTAQLREVVQKIEA